MTLSDELTPQPGAAPAGETLAASGVDAGTDDFHALSAPPGGALNLDDMMAAALAAVEAVEAGESERTSAAHNEETVEIPENWDAVPAVESRGSAPLIRGMPTVSSTDLRSQLTEQVRDLKLALSDARRTQERARLETEQLQADLGVLRKRYQKLGTEHDELRRRLQRAELDLPDYGSRQVLAAILGPLDNLHDVFTHLATHEPLTPEGREALSMLQSQWERALAGLQVTPYDALGQMYDAQVHECIAQTPSDQPVGHVIRQVGRGYLLAGRLLRSARVLVSAGAPQVQSPED